MNFKKTQFDSADLRDLKYTVTTAVGAADIRDGIKKARIAYAALGNKQKVLLHGIVDWLKANNREILKDFIVPERDRVYSEYSTDLKALEAKGFVKVVKSGKDIDKIILLTNPFDKRNMLIWLFVDHLGLYAGLNEAAGAQPKRTSFTEFLAEEKNTHMMHIENAILYQGVDGTRKAIQALKDLYDMLSGGSSEGKMITQKWDGAPAVFLGPAPDDGKFFVAKKGIFNKDPKVYKSVADIKADTSGDLAVKLIAVFNAFKDFGLKTILQGDLMFTKSDVDTETISGEKLYTFQPNTIVYAVPADSDLGKRIKSADVGIVFHTEYRGTSYETLSANFNIDINHLKKKSSKVWIEDAYVSDVSGQIQLDPKSASAVKAALSAAESLFDKANKSVLKQIGNSGTLAREIEAFQNTFIRAGVEIVDTQKHVNDLIKWYEARFAKTRDARKSEKGKASVDAERDATLAFFSESNRKELKLLFDLQRAMIIAKKILFTQLDALNSVSTFVRTNDGFRVTGSEGFVIVDKLSSRAYKIVDRLEFSKNNFSKDIIKGWER